MVIMYSQPYRRSNPSAHPLAMLKWLSNTDKHQVINPVLLLPHEMQFWPISVTGGGILTRWEVLPQQGALKVGTKVVEMRIEPPGAKAHVKMGGYVVPKVAFTNGYDVIRVLDGIREGVLWYFKEFGSTFNSQNQRLSLQAFREGQFQGSPAGYYPRDEDFPNPPKAPPTRGQRRRH